MRLVYEHLTDIPLNFTEVEYLQSSGTQYINTGYKFTSSMRFKINHIPTGSISDNYFTGHYATDNKVFVGGFYQNKCIWGIGQLQENTINASANQRFVIDMTYTSNSSANTSSVSGTINGQSVSLNSIALQNFVYGLNILAFARNNNGSIGHYLSCKLYSFQIYDSDTLVRDFVPCLDNNNVPCLYDKVEGKAYYNAGTGSFTYGRKIIPVEYLESSGTQWINTGIFPTNEMEFESKFTFTSLVSTNLTVIGSRDSTKRCQPIGAYNNKWSASIGGSYDANGSSVSANTSYVVKSIISNGQTITLTVNDNQASVCTSTTGLPNQELYIFGRNFYGNTDPVDSRINAKMYFMKIKAGNILVRDFVPCKDENNVGFMFDRVTHTAYLNAGTGSFITGSVKPKKKLRLIRESKRRLPKNFREVEYLQSSGGAYIDTGYVFQNLNHSTTITFKGLAAGSGGQPYHIFGSNKDNNRSGALSGISGNNNYIGIGIGGHGSGSSTERVATPTTPKTMTVVSKSTNKFDWLVDGTKVYSDVSFTGSSLSGISEYIFGINFTSDLTASTTVYHYQAEDNGVIVRDMIPCIDPLGVPCMYDLVSKKPYYNQGTGTFTVGRQVIPVEYLESSGTQYINIGVSTAEGICTEAKFKLNSITSTSQVVFGKVGSTTPPMSRYWFGAQGSSLKWYYAVNEYIATSVNADADIHTVVLDTVNDVCTLDGETIATFSDLNSNSETISLFSVFYQGSLNNPMSGRIYYTKIWNNGTLVRDFIPVKDENNVGYMFDKVTHSLYANAGTGSFVVGNEIKQDITRFVKDDVPNIYQKVSYLQSSGTQYIDTGYAVKLTDKIKSKVYLGAFTTPEMIFGSRGSASSNYYQLYYSSSQPGYGAFGATGVEGIVSCPLNQNSFNEFEMSNGKFVNNGVTTNITSGTEDSTKNLGLFARNNNDDVWSSKGSFKMYYLQIVDNNNTLVRDFVPVVRKSDNKPGMYDRVSKQFFTNSGTGEFTYG